MRNLDNVHLLEVLPILWFNLLCPAEVMVVTRVFKYAGGGHNNSNTYFM